jgi:hypothetical protein
MDAMAAFVACKDRSIAVRAAARASMASLSAVTRNRGGSSA